MRALVLIVAVVAAGALSASALGAVTPPQVSSNWSGYVIAAPADSAVPFSFTDVTGSWMVPKTTCTGGAGTAAAFWVGLGGNDPASSSLQQLGTSVSCSSSNVPTYNAWWEIVPAASVTIPLKIFPGDSITAALVVNGPTVIMSLKDVTRKTRFTKTITPAQALDTASAEWVAEAPSSCTSSGQRCRTLSLANFGSMAFTNAAAIGNGHAGTINDPFWDTTPIALNADSRSSFGRFSPPTVASLGAVPGALTADGRGFSVVAQLTAP